MIAESSYTMTRYFLFLLVCSTLSGYAQNTINNYQYVLVPEQYSFSKEMNQYGLNTLTKSWLEEKGFTVYFDNKDLPTEIANNKCKAMNADLIEKSGLFTTTLTLVLKDCQGNVVFRGKEGKSREKEYRDAYADALKNAFVSLDELSYTFSGDDGTAAEVSDTPANKRGAAVESSDRSGTLYAQETANGFQLVDTTPKKVLTLFKTSIQDFFIAEKSQYSGVVLKKEGKWFFEYYNNENLIVEELLIKF